jgi:hypothetical protein
MTEKRDCAGSTDQGRAGLFPCANAGKYEEDGKWWCGTHRPSMVAARQAKRDAAYRAERDAIVESRVVGEKLAAHLAELAGVRSFPHFPGDLKSTYHSLSLSYAEAAKLIAWIEAHS